jgi:eukaryotic-like serine/threonine-protein kinase
VRIDETTPEAPVAIGEVLAGKYRVERVLGKGGMGVVVAATHVELGQRVALKFLLPDRAGDPELHRRFLREARAVANLRTEHVTRVRDVGMLPNGAPFIVMDLLEGRDLGAVLLQRGRLPIAEVAEYVLQACEAVGEAHRAGIVHRDLKPANLFLTTRADGLPCVKVLDFGVARVAGVMELKLTETGQMVGSPLYMSPEQMKGRVAVDPRADIWALGIILHELVAGRPPFSGDSLVLTTKVLLMPPQPLREVLPGAPAAFEAVILRCLEKERERRWPDVGALAEALLPFASPRAAPYAARVAGVLGIGGAGGASRLGSLVPLGVAATLPAMSVQALGTHRTTTSGATAEPAPPQPRRRTLAAVTGAAIVAVGLACAGLVMLRLGALAPSAPNATVTVLPVASSNGGAGLSLPADPVASTAPSASASTAAPAAAAQPGSSTVPSGGAPKPNVAPRLAPTVPPAPTPRPPDLDTYSRDTRTR